MAPGDRVTYAGGPNGAYSQVRVMPAQGLDDASAAAVLNHVAAQVAKTNAKPFTAAEVATVRASSAGMNSAAVGKLHATVGGK